MVATTCGVDITVYTMLGSDANALRKDFTALQQEDEWTWPPTGLNEMMDLYSGSIKS